MGRKCKGTMKELGSIKEIVKWRGTYVMKLGIELEGVRKDLRKNLERT